MMEAIRVNDIDLDKYIGTGLSNSKRAWHQIAAFPAWFQKGLRKIKAVYIRKEDHVEVRNSGIDSNGKLKTQIGKAYLSSKPNVLKVKFFPIQPAADYIIEYLDTRYQYVIVGSSRKNYLWILARGRVTDEIYKDLVSIAKRKGYDVSRLER